MPDCVHVPEGSVDRGSQIRWREDDGGREDGEGGRRELQEGLCARAKFLTGNKFQYSLTNFELGEWAFATSTATACR